MTRLQASAVALGILITIGPAVTLAVQNQSALASFSGDNPAELVRQLGDRSFAVRRNATARLVALGVHSIGALQQGVQSKDREISFRSRFALKRVRENDFQRRLRAFATGQEMAESYQLPGWTRFAKEVGSDPGARALFVEMQRAEPELLEAVEQTPDKVGEILTLRIVNLQDAIVRGHQANQLSLGTIASMLFVLNGQHVQLPAMLTQSVGSYFRYPSFRSAIQAGSYRELLRGMLGSWIKRSEGWDAYHAMFLAMQYDLPIGLTPAKRILEGELGGQNQSYFLGYALLTFAKFGDSSHFPLIEPLLENKTPYGGTIAVAGKTKYRTQVRDIALATLVQLAKLDHKEFGFTRFRTNSTQVFNTSSIAFANDAEREIAIKKWRDRNQRKAE